MDTSYKPTVAVVIPCYKVTKHVLGVIEAIDRGYVDKIYAVDDCCPDKSGDVVEHRYPPEQVTVIQNDVNQGVGGAVIAGYKRALADNMDIIVKIDGDGQMDPRLISDFITPIWAGEADYTKGNRFYNLDKITDMPRMRLFGNAILSFLTKLSSGYWNLFDPTNGYTAIHREVLQELPFDKLSKRYFFESDILFRLNTIRAVVVDVPMDAKYHSEQSNLKINKIIGEFLIKHTRNFAKRIFYNYFLRDASVASIELPLGLGFFLFGIIYGSLKWTAFAKANLATPVGTVILASLTTLIGLQLLLSFLAYDINSVPSRVRHRYGKNFSDCIKQ